MIPRRHSAPGSIDFVRARPTWALYLLLGLFSYLETIIGPAMPFISDRLDLSFTTTSLHFSAFAAGAVVSGFSGDRVVLRWGRRTTLWCGMTGMVAGVASLTVSPFVSGTILGAFVTGAAGTLAIMANQSSLSDIHREHRSIALAESNVVASSVAVTAPLAVGGFDTVGLGWQSALLLGAPALLLLWWQFKDVKLPDPMARNDLIVERGRLPRLFWIYWCVLFMACAVEWCVAFWGAEFLDTVVGLQQAAAATAMSIFFGAMVAGRMIGARLTRSQSGSTLLVYAFFVALIGFPIFWLSPSPIVSLIGLFVAGIGIANFYPLTIAAATDAVPERPDQATARLAISGGSALLIVPFIVGAISDLVGMRWGFGIVMPLLIGALVATLYAYRSKTPVEETPGGSH
jgi:MFS family permease